MLPLLPSVMVRFRMSPIVLSSDISKMFREIELLDRDRDYHRYLAKDNQGEVRDWRMLSLTFRHQGLSLPGDSNSEAAGWKTTPAHTPKQLPLCCSNFMLLIA